MRQLLALLCVLLPAGALAQVDPEPPPNPATPDPGVRCVIETDCLALAADTAERLGEELVLRLGNGTTRVFRDDRKSCADLDADLCVEHRLVAYLPASGAIVVAWNGSETGGAILVDPVTGAETRLPAEPAFSPSGRRLVCLGRDETDRDDDVAVYARRDGAWVEETRFSGGPPDRPEAWSLDRWDGDDRIGFTYRSAIGEGKAVMTWDGQGWQVDKGGPARP